MDINRKELLPATLLTFLMAFLELSGLPAALFVHVNFYDIEPMYFVLMVNFVIAGLACVLCKKFLLKKWRFGLSVSGIGSGLIRYGQPAAIVAVIIAAAYCIGLSPFNNSPTVWRIAIEGFIYYIGVGIIEELYLRGLLQNIIKYLFRNSKNAALYAVLAASAIFGLGHMFGATGQPLVTVVCKVIWAFAIGVYLGSVYFCTQNLSVSIILHMVIDLVGIPFLFTTTSQYPAIGLTVSLVCFLFLGCYGIILLMRKTNSNVL